MHTVTQTSVCLFISAVSLLTAADKTSSFEKSVQPVLRQSCTACHNDKLSSGGLNINGFLDPTSVTANREGWERILTKLRAGEMPPTRET